MLASWMGGYDSVLFAMVSIGSYIIGGVLMAFWRWLFPAPACGSYLIFLWLVHSISNEPDPTRVAGIIPLVWLLMSFLGIGIVFLKGKRNKKHGDNTAN